MRSLASLAVVFLAIRLTAAQAPPSIPPLRFEPKGWKTAAEIAARMEKQSGLKIALGPIEPTTTVEVRATATYWELLEAIAAQTGTRVVPNPGTRSPTFAKGPARTAPSLDGAFRIAAQSVTAKSDAVSGQIVYSLALDVDWEPRFPVFRIDAFPRNVQASDDRGTNLTVKSAAVKSAVTGFAHTADIRIDGLARPAQAIARISGEFTVTASPRMLAFEFANLTKLPATAERDGVKATLQPIRKRDEVWELGVTVEYPADPPAFESFESWTNRNAMRLVAPNGHTISESDNQDVTTSGRVVRAAHRYAFKVVDLANTTGWKVVYETPAPLVEFPVKFQLKDIALP